MATFIDRISSMDAGYKTGDLSLFPLGKDNFTSLYKATNNAVTYLSQSLSYTAKFIVVNDTSTFPDSGLIKIGTEIIFYTSKTNTVFKGLKRGFAGSGQKVWQSGEKVYGSVMAEHHNAIKDAAINIESDLGVKVSPVKTSLNGILSEAENIFLSPSPLFRAAPQFGAPPLKVHFQNFSDAPAVRFLWDFGDGSTSQIAQPTHTYLASGKYSVQLSMITPLGATGIVSKTNYINVNIDDTLPFFYASTLVGNTTTVFTLVDQTKGNIASRYWVWDDGTNTAVADADVHTADHQYTTKGQYSPSLLILLTDGTQKLVYLNEMITVI